MLFGLGEMAWVAVAAHRQPGRLRSYEDVALGEDRQHQSIDLGHAEGARTRGSL